jgi:hypothetical protein
MIISIYELQKQDNTGTNGSYHQYIIQEAMQ